MSQRTEMIKRELNEHKASNQEATYAITLRGKKVYLPVIRVNPALLLLNPKNNRLSGQLKDHPKRSQVEAEPDSSESQSLLHSLLSATAKFSDLSKQLKVMGQQEPGLITQDGLLVNGNTRVAALRELDINYVEVAVLTSNITDTDVLDMEMSLQVTDLVHQDYTFTNELLLMKRFLDAGNSPEALAKKMAWITRGVIKVQAHMRLLGYIEEVRTLAPIPYSVFDSKKQHLKDLDDDYMRLKGQGNIDGAEALKWSRITMTLLKLNKDQVRAIDSDFVEKNLLPRLSDESQETRDHLEKFRAKEADDGLDDLLGEKSPTTINMKEFLKDLMSDESVRAEDGDITKDLSGIYVPIAFNARRATEEIIDDQKLQSANAEPSLALKEAKVKIAKVRQKLPLIMRDPRFEIKKFIYNLDELRSEIDALRAEIKKATDE
jgi:ParB-like chromosome segregation protein Spo0J